MPNSVIDFDTSFLDRDELGKFRYFEAALPKQNAKIQTAIIEMGQTLLGMQDLLSKHKTGKFTEWLSLRTPFSKTSAYNAMAAATVFSNCPNLDKLEVSAMYVLAESGTSEKARKEALKIAEKGGNVTHAAAKELQAKHKEPAEPRDPPPSRPPSQSDQPSNGRPDEPEEPPPPAAPAAPEKPPAPPTIEERMAEWNRSVEAAAKAVTSALDDAPTGPWLGDGEDDNRLGIAKDQLKSAASTIRLAKCPHVCCKCDGAGCKACRNSGMMPKNTFTMMGGAK